MTESASVTERETDRGCSDRRRDRAFSPAKSPFTSPYSLASHEKTLSLDALSEACLVTAKSP